MTIHRAGRITRIVAALAVAGLAAAGCGGSSGSSTGGSGGKSDSSLSDPRTPQELAADRMLARRALLKLSDFPAGWQATPHDDNDEGPDLEKQLADCLDVPEALIVGSGDKDSVDSPDFESPDNAEVMSSVSLGPTAEDVQKVFEVMHNPNVPKCFGDAIDEVLSYSMSHDEDAPKNITIGKVTLGELNLPGFAEDSVAFRTKVPMAANGIDTQIYLDFVFMRQDRGVTFLGFLSIFSPFPIEETEKYAGIAEKRLTSLAL